MKQRIEREKRTVTLMIEMHCSHFHQMNGGLCEDCIELQQYAMRQTEQCRFGGEKPVCSACPVHCYKREMREQIRKVMRFSGPRMIWRHPRLAILHLRDKKSDEISHRKFKTYNIK